MEQVPSQICVFLKLPPRLELLCRGFLISSPQADVCSGKLGDFILTARHLLGSSYWTELIWRLPIILFLKKKKKAILSMFVFGEKVFCVWGVGLWSWDWGEGGSWFLQTLGWLCCLILLSKQCHAQGCWGFLQTTRRHWPQRLGKMSALHVGTKEIWPDPVKIREIARFQPRIH